MAILQSTGVTGSLAISSSGLNTGSILISVDGYSGRVFSVDDNLSGSLFSVNTIAGLPVVEAFSDNTVNIGKYNAEAIRVVDSGKSVTLGSGSVMYVSSSGKVGLGTTNPINKMDVAGNISCSVITGSLFGPQILFANTTVSFTNTQSTAEIQALINAQPKNLNGKTLVFSFADGTYALTGAYLNFDSFFGGYININGNSANNSSNINKNVIIKADVNRHAMYVINTGASVSVNYIKFVVTCSNSSTGLYIEKTPYAAVNYCAFTNVATSSAANSGIGIQGGYGREHISQNVFSALQIAVISGYNNTITSDSNTNVATSSIGLYASAGTIHRIGQQPTGSTATSTANGGQIW